MKILITGAFGQIGLCILNYITAEQNRQKLEEKFNNLEIICFDLPNRKIKRAARKFRKFSFLQIIYGDIRNKELIAKIIKDINIVYHLAFRLPPIPDDIEPTIREINVGGLVNVIESIKNNKQNTKIIYPASIDMYGHVPKEKQPIIPGSETNPTDHYGRHKVASLKLLQESGLDYAAFVLTVVPPLHYLAQNPAMFDVEVDSNVELVHEEDVARAFYNALLTDKIWTKILLIAGGDSCRLTYFEFINKMMIASGIGSLDLKLFQGNLYHFAFMDTTESQNILDFQRHSTEDIINDMKKNNSFTFFIIKLLKPIVRRFLIKQSPYR
ncbi:MAG: NAD(P)-dependent oxidoreductase [Asgard group archaeon]|nr:NAD(P)-dependent oxidoreductase [Asgard group archaeon]